MATLTTTIPWEQGLRIFVGRPVIDDDAQVLTVPIEIRSGPTTNYLLVRRSVNVRNAPAKSDRVVRATPPVGANAEDKLLVEPNALDLANGFDTALAAWAGGGAGPAAKRTALTTALIALAVIDPSTLAAT